MSDYKIDKSLLGLKPYQTLEGAYPVRMDVNESFVSLPDSISNKFKKALDGIVFNRYPDPAARNLRQAFADYYGVDADNTTAGNGSDELIGLIIETFLKDGGKVLITPPDFSMYAFYTELRKGQTLSLPKTGLTADTDDLLAAVRREKPEVLIFSNPCNPTGGVINADKVLSLVENCPCLVVVDEAYMDFCPQSILSKACDYDNLIVLRTMSKFAGAAALRLGFAVANPTISNILQGTKSVFNLNAVTQAFGEILYREKAFLEENRAAVLSSVKSLYAGLSAFKTVMGVPFISHPTAANFVWIQTEKAELIYKALLSEGIAVRYFQGYLRISAGAPQENETLFQKLRGLL